MSSRGSTSRFTVMWPYKGPQLRRPEYDLLMQLGAPTSVPFELVLAHKRQCLRNHDQTPTQLNARGGLDIVELAAVLGDLAYPWERRNERNLLITQAVAQVLAAVEAFEAGSA